MNKFFKNGVLGFIMGIMLSFVLIFGIAFAAGNNTALDVVTNSVNIMLDGRQVGVQDANYTLDNGNQVPFSILYKGTTYLPIRKLSELLNKDVGYIAETRTITLGQSAQVQEPGWYLINSEFTDEIDTFKEGTFSSSEQYWETDAAYTSKEEGSVAWWTKYYIIDKSTNKREAPEEENSASFTWTSPADFIPVNERAQINASLSATDDFGASINASIHSFHHLSPEGDGEAHYIHVEDPMTTLKTMALEESTPGKTITIQLKLNALSDQTVYEYTYEYRE
jgi:hypothetical protein